VLFFCFVSILSYNTYVTFFVLNPGTLNAGLRSFGLKVYVHPRHQPPQEIEDYGHVIRYNSAHAHWVVGKFRPCPFEMVCIYQPPNAHVRILQSSAMAAGA
jgi:hypothetical protein